MRDLIRSRVRDAATAFVHYDPYEAAAGTPSVFFFLRLRLRLLLYARSSPHI
jgi:hypothetical protein